MEGSLSSIFLDNNLPTLPVSWCDPTETTEDLKQLLLCTSMELESERANAKAQGELHEAKVRHLEELLNITRKERDEALQQCLKLQETLASSFVLQGYGGNCDNSTRQAERDSLSCSYVNSSVPSPSSGLLQIDCVSSMPELGKGGGESFSEVQWKFQDLQDLEQELAAGMEGTQNGQIQQEQQHFSPQAVLEEIDELMMVSSSNTAPSTLPSPISLHHNPSLPLPLPPLDFDLQHEWASPQASIPPCPPSFPTISGLQNVSSMQKLHLPEPPEADPRVMLKSLPEKGKLLQAVLQAGPLLQTLLLAGPLPQWRYPPPVLDTTPIPRVAMPSSPSPPLSQPRPLCDSLSLHSQMTCGMGSTRVKQNNPIHPAFPTMQYSSPIGFCSASKRLRRPLAQSFYGIGHDIIRLTDAPLKYAKIY